MDWDWLMAVEGDHDVVEDVLRIAELIDDCPDSSATFRPTDAGIKNRHHLERIVILNDSWFLPDRFSGNRDQQRAINPNYPHRQIYAEAPAKCECGAVIAKENDWYDTDDGECRLDSCNTRYACEAKAELWKRRERILVQSTQFFRSPDYIADRMGCEQGTLSDICKALNVERNKIKNESIDELKTVLPELYDKYTAEDLGRVFNRSSSTIRRWANA